MLVITACSVVYVATIDTESLTGPEAVTKAIDSTLELDPAPKTTVVHFKVSSQGITLTDLRHRSYLFITFRVRNIAETKCILATAVCVYAFV